MSDTEEKPEPVLVKERRGAVAVLRLNRPEARNALNPELLTAIGLGMLEAEDDPDVRAVVLTGTGEKAFCAGMDLRAFAEGGALGGDPEGMKGFARFTQGEIGVPVVGAANATAVAGGFELAPGVRRRGGLGGGLVRRPRGQARALRGGRRRVREHAHPAGGRPGADADRRSHRRRAGAVVGAGQQVVPPGEVLDAAVALAERIARNGPLALRATKELVRTASTDLERARALAAEWQPKVFGSEDAKEGATAFIEKRDPVWKGR